jgi:phosphoglycerate dehydrogenase-like enzyme
LVAEDDAPMRLVALALGHPGDRALTVGLDRLFAGQARRAAATLRDAAAELGLVGRVEAHLARPGPLAGQVSDVAYLLVEGAAVTADALARAPALRLIQKHGEDCRNIDLAAARRRGVPVAVLRRTANAAVAEHTLLLMLAVARRLPAAQVAARTAVARAPREPSQYNWARLSGVMSLGGRTLGLVGLGEVGRAVARRAAALGMRILYTQRRRLPAALERALGAAFRPLPALLAESDVVSLHVPLTDGTRRLIDRAAIARMRRGAILVNTARGALVDEAALRAALRTGHLAGAGLDVRAEEPPGAPGLAALPTVVATPHVAAGSGAELVRDARAVLANISRVRRGGAPAELAVAG